MAAVLIDVMWPDSWAVLSMVPGAWSVSCAYWRPVVFFGLSASCLLCSLAVPGVESFILVNYTCNCISMVAMEFRKLARGL